MTEVAFQRMFGILERWNNNQVTSSFSKPHELSYRSNSYLDQFYSLHVQFLYIIFYHNVYPLHEHFLSFHVCEDALIWKLQSQKARLSI